MKDTRDIINAMITNNYNNLKIIANKFNNKKDEPEDILQESVMQILSQSDSKLEKYINNEVFLIKTIVKIIKLSFISRTSYYQNKYNKLVMQDTIEYNIVDLLMEDNDQYNHDIDEQLEDIEFILENELNFFHETLIREKKIKSLNKISRDCGIPLSSVWKAHNRAMYKLKKIMNKKWK